MSGGGKNELVSSEEPPELSGIVPVHHHVLLGLAGAGMGAFSHQPKHNSSVSSVAAFVFKVVTLCGRAKPLLSVSVKELHRSASQEGTSPAPTCVHTYTHAGERLSLKFHSPSGRIKLKCTELRE